MNIKSSDQPIAFFKYNDKFQSDFSYQDDYEHYFYLDTKTN